MPEILLSCGNYQKLESYQNCIIIFNATFDFCNLFLQKNDRTFDQMIQAARSGKQNIVEGSVDAKVSTESEIKLLGIARGSLEDLLIDYQDYLRTRNLILWSKEDERVLNIRQFVRQKNKTYTTYKTYFRLGSDTPELFCNLLISLIHQTNYLLDRQLRSLEKNFIEQGGLRERMFRVRTEYRSAEREEALSLLRELYRETGLLNRPDLQEKIEKIATILKGGAK